MLCLNTWEIFKKLVSGGVGVVCDLLCVGRAASSSVPYGGIKAFKINSPVHTSRAADASIYQDSTVSAAVT